MTGPTWTIAELGERIARALARDDAPESGRIRAVPDERAIRYYTTLGLLDRPALRGRTALYGPRQLAQLVAIKRLQAGGKSLAEIQHELPGLDDAALAALSGVALTPVPRPKGRAGFWKAAPVEAAPVEAAPAGRQPWLGSPAPSSPALGSPALRLELDLGEGVRISFAPARPLSDHDLVALRLAGASLLAYLVDRALVDPTPGEPR